MSEQEREAAAEQRRCTDDLPKRNQKKGNNQKIVNNMVFICRHRGFVWHFAWLYHILKGRCVVIWPN